MKPGRLVPHATTIVCAFAAAMLAGLLLTSVPAGAGIDVQINIGNAPPAPHFVFSARPHERYYSAERIYVVDDPGIGDYDCFRYGGYYWVFSGGYWYRSPSWRGRFVVVHPRYVPTMFYRMPARQWKHRPSGPPAFTNRSGGGSPGLMQRRASGPPQPMNRSGGRPPQLTGQSGGGSPQPMNRSNSRPPQVVRRSDGGPPAGQTRGGSGSVAPVKRSGGSPPGLAKKSGGEPSGHAKKDAKGNDKGGGHGGK